MTARAADVEALLDALSHPHRAEIDALRDVVRGADPRVRESVKWNAPSFATTEHFATFHLVAAKRAAFAAIVRRWIALV